jgi:hypothetical protein
MSEPSSSLVGGARVDGGTLDVGVFVAQRQEETGERDAVADGMMEADEEQGAVPRAVDQVEVPQGSLRIQGPTGEIVDQSPQRLFVTGWGHDDPAEVVVEVEVRIRLPHRTLQRETRPDDPLAEALVAVDEAALENVPGPVEIEVIAELEEPGDDHAVARRVHPQPGGVHVRERLPRHGSSGRPVAPVDAIDPMMTPAIGWRKRFGLDLESDPARPPGPPPGVGSGGGPTPGPRPRVGER